LGIGFFLQEQAGELISLPVFLLFFRDDMHEPIFIGANSTTFNPYSKGNSSQEGTRQELSEKISRRVSEAGCFIWPACFFCFIFLCIGCKLLFSFKYI